jgi:hypothetical protein
MRPPGGTIVWAGLLGPGLVTRNPYAGMWLLPLLIPLQSSLRLAAIVGAAVGIAHGGTRGVGVLANRRNLTSAGIGILDLARSQLRWRLADGLALILIGGLVAVRLARMIVGHP